MSTYMITVIDLLFEAKETHVVVFFWASASLECEKRCDGGSSDYDSSSKSSCDNNIIYLNVCPHQSCHLITDSDW
jgi:hypothetical protein